jgi:hypothetical protein
MDDTELDTFQLDLLMIISWEMLWPLKHKLKHPSSNTMQQLAMNDTLKVLISSQVESKEESADALINKTTTKMTHQGLNFWNQNDSFLNQNDCASKRLFFNIRSKIFHKLANLVLICESQSNQRRPCLTWDLVLHCLTRWFQSIIDHK